MYNVLGMFCHVEYSTILVARFSHLVVVDLTVMLLEDYIWNLALLLCLRLGIVVDHFEVSQ